MQTSNSMFHIQTQRMNKQTTKLLKLRSRATLTAYTPKIEIVNLLLHFVHWSYVVIILLVRT